MKQAVTHRALELGPLAPATLDNVVQADLCVAEMLALGPARDRTGCAIATAVAVEGVAVIVCEAAVGAGPSALEARARPALLRSQGIGAHGRAPAPTTTIRRDAALA